MGVPLTSWWVNIPAIVSRGTRAVKGAGFRSQCVVLRRFESCPLHHHCILILLDLILARSLFFSPAIL